MCYREEPDFNNDFAEGFTLASSTYVNVRQSMSGEQEVNKIVQSIAEISDSINKFNGKHIDVKILKGNVMESLVPMDFNLRAQLAGSRYRAIQLESNKLASVDVAIVNNFNEVVLKYSFKDMKNPKASARAQATSYYDTIGKSILESLTKKKCFLFLGSREWKSMSRICMTPFIQDRSVWCLKSIYQEPELV